MSRRLTVVLLYGGKSGEHEISLRSACSVLKALDNTKYNIIPLGIDKEGKYYINQYDTLIRSAEEALPVRCHDAVELNSLTLHNQFALPADIVLPMVHGPLYEDGCLQGLLELAQVAYVGCGVLSSSIGMDKDIVRRLLAYDAIPFTRYVRLSTQFSPLQKEKVLDELLQVSGFPLFVKPCSLGSSVGIHKVKNKEELTAAIQDACLFDEEVLVEAFVQGREIEIAVLENPEDIMAPHISLPGEILVKHSDEFYSYHAKYVQADKTELLFPAKLSHTMIKRLQSLAAQIFINIKCRGMARIDFFVNEETDTIYFNEINTIPGFTSISMYPKLWEVSGLTYPDLLDKLILLGLKRFELRSGLKADYC